MLLSTECEKKDLADRETCNILAKSEDTRLRLYQTIKPIPSQTSEGYFEVVFQYPLESEGYIEIQYIEMTSGLPKAQGMPHRCSGQLNN